MMEFSAHQLLNSLPEGFQPRVPSAVLGVSPAQLKPSEARGSCLREQAAME